MPDNLKAAVKDSRLWIQSSLTILLTALVSLGLSGALSLPGTVREPQSPTDHPTPVTAALAAHTDPKG